MSDHLVLFADRLVTPESLSSIKEAKEPGSSGEGSSSHTGDEPTCAIDVQGVGEHGASEEEPLLQTMECRICQEEDSINNLEVPCACSGSLKHQRKRARVTTGSTSSTSVPESYLRSSSGTGTRDIIPGSLQEFPEGIVFIPALGGQGTVHRISAGSTTLPLYAPGNATHISREDVDRLCLLIQNLKLDYSGLVLMSREQEAELARQQTRIDALIQELDRLRFSPRTFFGEPGGDTANEDEDRGGEAGPSGF